MKTLISGHRQERMGWYNTAWIEHQIERAILELNTSIGLSGMANGVDLIFCRLCEKIGIHLHCYVPFEGQSDYMSVSDTLERLRFITKYTRVDSRNSAMVEKCDNGIIVFDGNKGGTHNVFQQMLENKKPFIWIEPNNQKTYKINS